MIDDHAEHVHADEPIARGYEYSNGQISIRYIEGASTISCTRDGGMTGRPQTLKGTADQNGLCAHLQRTDWAGYDETVSTPHGSGLQPVTVTTYKVYAHPRTKLPDTAPQRD